MDWPIDSFHFNLPAKYRHADQLLGDSHYYNGSGQSTIGAPFDSQALGAVPNQHCFTLENGTLFSSPSLDIPPSFTGHLANLAPFDLLPGSSTQCNLSNYAPGRQFHGQKRALWTAGVPSPHPLGHNHGTINHSQLNCLSEDRPVLNCLWLGCRSHNSFASVADLMRHLKSVHIAPKAFICPEVNCNSRFGRKDHLAVHQRTHQRH
ncbi:hypothetical protein BDW74DRAFT_177959 [Aspergillus multicolor]|uniref:uncharacterized protein n=1 Tax=Aspergillus multicolor TaxID=41759 RepID=UPI003CCE4C55